MDHAALTEGASDVSGESALTSNPAELRFGIDAQRLSGQRLGVGRYIEYLLRQWASQLHSIERMTVYVRESMGPQPRLPEAMDVRVIAPRLPAALWQHLALPLHARDVDVLFCPSYSMPLHYSGRCVLAIHSVNEVKQGAHPWWYRLRYTELYRRSARRADRVIVPSHSTAGDVHAAYGVPLERVSVVPQGADEAFRPLDDPGALRAARLRWLGEDRPFVLWVGKLSQRRNIPLLLRAFARLKDEQRIPHALLLMGPNHVDLPLERLIEGLGLVGDVIQTDGRISSHEELVPVYNAAELYINASLYEGFSMTLVEALSCGTPVVAARSGALPEIAGDAAVLVDDLTEEGLADSIYRVLSDTALKKDLSHRSVERAALFRWSTTASLTLDVMRRVAQEV